MNDNLFELLRVYFYAFFAYVGVAICYVLTEILNCSGLVSLLFVLIINGVCCYLIERSKDRRDQKWREGMQCGSE